MAMRNLLENISGLISAGVTSFRLSPHSGDMVGIIRLFQRALAREVDGQEAGHGLAMLLPGAAFSNGFLSGPYGAAFERA
jgi:O2-independent ubiquinone biosynthesis protein UbiV